MKKLPNYHFLGDMSLIQKTWIKLGICLVYFYLWFKIIDMENLSHEWLHDFMCIIYFLIYLLIGAHEVSNLSPPRFFMWVFFNHRIKYTRQKPSLIQVFSGHTDFFFTFWLTFIAPLKKKSVFLRPSECLDSLFIYL